VLWGEGGATTIASTGTAQLWTLDGKQRAIAPAGGMLTVPLGSDPICLMHAIA
jgi:hypothetical protein